MLCVERMAVHLVEGVNCRVCVSEFDEGISMRGSTLQVMAYMWVDLPMTLSGPVVPRHGDIIGFDGGTFPCKLFHDF